MADSRVASDEDVAGARMSLWAETWRRWRCVGFRGEGGASLGVGLPRNTDLTLCLRVRFTRL